MLTQENVAYLSTQGGNLCTSLHCHVLVLHERDMSNRHLKFQPNYRPLRKCHLLSRDIVYYLSRAKLDFFRFFFSAAAFFRVWWVLFPRSAVKIHYSPQKISLRVVTLSKEASQLVISNKLRSEVCPYEQELVQRYTVGRNRIFFLGLIFSNFFTSDEGTRIPKRKNHELKRM